MEDWSYVPVLDLGGARMASSRLRPRLRPVFEVLDGCPVSPSLDKTI